MSATNMRNCSSRESSFGMFKMEMWEIYQGLERVRHLKTEWNIGRCSKVLKSSKKN